MLWALPLWMPPRPPPEATPLALCPAQPPCLCGQSQWQSGHLTGSGWLYTHSPPPAVPAAPLIPLKMSTVASLTFPTSSQAVRPVGAQEKSAGSKNQAPVWPGCRRRWAGVLLCLGWDSGSLGQHRGTKEGPAGGRGERQM